VGKSSLLIRFVRDEYHEKTRSTISAAYLTRRVETNSRTVQFEIWDTAGQERFRSLNTPMYYRGAAGAVIVYDVSDPTSFKNARGWYTQLKMLGEKEVQVILVGNKSDLADGDEQREATKAAAQVFAQQNNLIHLETSARSGINVEEVFVELANKMPQPNAAPPSSSAVDLQPQSAKKSSDEKCCVIS